MTYNTRISKIQFLILAINNSKDEAVDTSLNHIRKDKIKRIIEAQGKLLREIGGCSSNDIYEELLLEILDAFSFEYKIPRGLREEALGYLKEVNGWIQSFSGLSHRISLDESSLQFLLDGEPIESEGTKSRRRRRIRKKTIKKSEIVKNVACVLIIAILLNATHLFETSKEEVSTGITHYEDYDESLPDGTYVKFQVHQGEFIEELLRTETKTYTMKAGGARTTIKSYIYHFMDVIQVEDPDGKDAAVILTTTQKSDSSPISMNKSYGFLTKEIAENAKRLLGTEHFLKRCEEPSDFTIFGRIKRFGSGDEVHSYYKFNIAMTDPLNYLYSMGMMQHAETILPGKTVIDYIPNPPEEGEEGFEWIEVSKLNPFTLLGDVVIVLYLIYECLLYHKKIKWIEVE